MPRCTSIALVLGASFGVAAALHRKEQPEGPVAERVEEALKNEATRQLGYIRDLSEASENGDSKAVEEISKKKAADDKAHAKSFVKAAKQATKDAAKAMDDASHVQARLDEENEARAKAAFDQKEAAFRERLDRAKEASHGEVSAEQKAFVDNYWKDESPTKPTQEDMLKIQEGDAEEERGQAQVAAALSQLTEQVQAKAKLALTSSMARLEKARVTHNKTLIKAAVDSSLIARDLGLRAHLALADVDPLSMSIAAAAVEVARAAVDSAVASKVREELELADLTARHWMKVLDTKVIPGISAERKVQAPTFVAKELDELHSIQKQQDDFEHSVKLLQGRREAIYKSGNPSTMEEEISYMQSKGAPEDDIKIARMELADLKAQVVAGAMISEAIKAKDTSALAAAVEKGESTGMKSKFKLKDARHKLEAMRRSEEALARKLQKGA